MIQMIVLALLVASASLVSGCDNSDSRSSVRTAPAPRLSDFKIENEAKGLPGDIQQARKFLADIPMPACDGTEAAVMSDGTVRIHVRCSGNGKSMDGMVMIRNGIVRNIQ